MALARSVPLRWLQIWLALVNVASLLLGLFLVFAGSSPLFAFYRRALAETFWSAESIPASAEPYFLWSMALIGAATVGWAVTNLFVVLTAFGRAEPWSFAALVFGTICWATLEIIVSVRAGALLEVGFVLGASVAVLVPTAVAWWTTREVSSPSS